MVYEALGNGGFLRMRRANSGVPVIQLVRMQRDSVRRFETHVISDTMSSTKITKAMAGYTRKGKRQTAKDFPEYYIKDGMTAIIPENAFIVQEIAILVNVRAFFLLKFLKENNVPVKRLGRSKSHGIYHAVDALQMSYMFSTLLEEIRKLRDDRNTRLNPDARPTIENLMFVSQDKRRFGKYENLDIPRVIVAGREKELFVNKYLINKLFRVNCYADGTYSLDRWNRKIFSWERVETPEKFKCGVILQDWKIRFGLILEEEI